MYLPSDTDWPKGNCPTLVLLLSREIDGNEKKNAHAHLLPPSVLPCVLSPPHAFAIQFYPPRRGR